MQAVWYERNGPAKDVLIQGTLSDPVPAEGELLVEIHASGINPSDVKRRDGWRGQAIAFDRVIPHNDGAGVVLSVGEGADPAWIGQRVWLHSAGWRRPFGTLGALAAVPASLASPLPNEVSFGEGACLGVPAMTAHRAVFSAGSVEGKTVFVHGGAGSVGFYAIQLAKWAGAQVATSVSSDEKAAIARRAGADLVINYRDQDVATEFTKAYPDGADHVVDVDFAANLPVNLKILKSDNGSIASFASMSDATPAVPFYDLMVLNIRLQLIFVYQMPDEAKEQAKQDIGAWLETGTSQHLIAQTFSMEDAVAAHEAVEAGHLIGNAVIEIKQA